MRNPRGKQPLPIAVGLVLSLLVGTVVAAPVGVQETDPELRYQRRGDRYEGLRGAMPASGERLTLLSALVHPREAFEAWPDRLQLRFYVPEPDGRYLAVPEGGAAARPEVFLTVRQLRPQDTFYWLDRLDPSFGWRFLAVNKFSWPTVEVLQQIPGLGVDDLGVVVRLEREHPGLEELVAPAGLYRARGPERVTAYRFTLKLGGHARVRCRILHGDGKRCCRLVHPDGEVFVWPRSQQWADQPFTVHWNSSREPEGWYQLVIDGAYDLYPDQKIFKKIVFYHQPVVPEATRSAAPPAPGR